MRDGFYWLAGVWGIAMVAIFIQAIRLCYRIEARSEGLRNTSGVPRKAMALHAILNWKVARDDETQALRRQINFLFLLNLLGFALLSVWLWWARV